jgi:predicted TIM-barrel fold metal-dependent hydrolase
LFEPPDMWTRYVDPADREVALRIADDELGYSWLTYRDRRLGLAEPHRPGEVDGIGRYRQRWLSGARSDFDYYELAEPYSDPAARLRHLDKVGFDAAVLFPNYGIVWERDLQNDQRATQANMKAWNRWIVDVATEGQGRLFPVAHVSLTDPDWLESQLAALAAGGVKLALIAPALVNGKAFSHPDLDRTWAAFVDRGITPVFHVANQPRPFDEAWYGEDLLGGVSPMTTIFLSTAAALALTDLILNGVLERHPDLRLGIMELSAMWVPLHLQMMDGGYRFTARFNGEAPPLSMAPSDYFRRQVRVAAFSFERPDLLTRRAGDLFMACSDYPHTEGTLTALDDYRAASTEPEEWPGIFSGNIGYLLRQ